MQQSQQAETTQIQAQSIFCAPAAEHKESLFTKAFVAAALINFFIFMGWQMTCVGIPVYIDELGGTEIEVGLVATIATITATLIRPFAGTLVDRFGRKVFLVGGLAFIVVATVAYAIFPIVGIVLSFRVLHGFGWGVGATANATLAADVVPKKRFSEGIGYLAMTGSLSMALGPVVAYALINTGNNELMIWGSAAFSLTALIIAAIFFATTYKQPPLVKGSMGTDYFKLSNLFEKSALFPSIVVMLVCLSFGTISAFIALHGAAVGISNVSIYFIVYAIVNLILRPFVGRFIDRHGFWLIGILSCLCFAVSIAVIGLASSVWMFGVGGALVGIGLGSAMNVFQTMAVSIVPPQRRGVATATYFFFFDIGIGLGAFVGGMLATAIGYSGMYLIMSLAPVVGCIVFVCAGKKRIDLYHVSQIS